MTLHEIYEKVNLVAPFEQRRFFNAYEDSINELLTLYDGFVLDASKGVTIDSEQGAPDKAWVENGRYYAIPASLSGENVALPLYHNAIVDNILFIAGAGGERNDTYKTEFIRKSRSAYLKYWSGNAKGRRIKRLGW